METNYIRWNAPNWITIFLMVMIAHSLLGFAYAVFKGTKGDD